MRPLPPPRPAAGLLLLACALQGGSGQRPAPFTIPAQPPDELQVDGEWWFYRLLDSEFPHTVVEPLRAENVALPGQTESGGVFRSLPDAEHILLEFFAPWCPICQHFAPELEKVVRTLDTAPGLVAVRSVDCERLEMRPVCDWAEANAMPRVLLAPRRALLGNIGPTSSSMPGVKDKFPVHDAQELLTWIQQSVPEAASLPMPEPVNKETPYFGYPQPAEGAAEPSQASPQDLAVAAASLLHQAFSGIDFNEGTRGALMDLLGLLCTAAPGGEACRNSACEMRSSLANQWDSLLHHKVVTATPEGDPVDPPFTANYLDWARIEREHTWCGKPWPDFARAGWSWCHGRTPGSRGYTCGLWMLMHSLLANSAAEAAAGEGAAGGLSAARRVRAAAEPPLAVLRRVIRHFFGCQECRDHFLAEPVTDEDLASPLRQAVWLWKTHNKATERIGREDREHNPAAPPRQVWPSASLCPRCRSADGSWNLQEVQQMLLRYYSSTQDPLSGIISRAEVKPAATLEVFYFTVCGHCQAFLEDSLRPLIEAQLPGDQVQISVLPLYPPLLLLVDKPDECRAEEVCHLSLAPLCALAKAGPQPAAADSPDFLRAARFIECDIGQTVPRQARDEASTKACAESAGIDWNGAAGLHACSEGDQAFHELRAGADKLSAAMKHLHDEVGFQEPPSMPWVLLNGELIACEQGLCSASMQPAGYRPLEQPGSLIEVVCSKLAEPKPEACRNATAAERKAPPPQPAAAQECENCAELGKLHWSQQHPEEAEAYRRTLRRRLLLAPLALVSVAALLLALHRCGGRVLRCADEKDEAGLAAAE